MSGAPGVTLVERDSAVSTAPRIDTAAAFIGGLAARGPVNTPVFAPTLAQYEAIFWGEVAYGYMWDAAKWIPKEVGRGSSPMWFIRRVGPAAKVSSLKLADVSKDTLEVLAGRYGVTEPGEWGDSIKVQVTAAEGAFTLIVSYEGKTVETLGPYADNAAAIAGVTEASTYIVLKDLGGADPKVAAATALAGGKDDRGNVTDEIRAAGLTLFSPDLGCGQVLYPGATTDAMHGSLLDHGEVNDRTAVLDGADTHTVGTHTASCAAGRALDSADCGGPFGPWAEVPGSVAETTKLIPYSIIEAGLMARRDADTYDSRFGVSNPNDPAAGTGEDAGVSRVAIGLSQEPWTDTERGTLNDAGFNVARVVNGRVVTYGYRTLADPKTKPLHWKLNNRRIDMAILAKAAVVSERFNFREVDGRGITLSKYAGALKSEILLPYLEVGALFGDDPDAAYSVDTSMDTVNPVEELMKGNVRAVIEACRSPFAEKILLEYVKRGVPSA